MKKAIITLACASMIVLTGCYGKNACFKKAHDFAGSFGNKWMNSIINFAFWVIPVYEVSLWLIDGLVLNTVEFWTGSNPLASGDSYYEKDAQGNEIAAVKNTDGSMAVEITTAAGEKANLTLQRDNNILRALDAEGNVVAQREIEQ